jgi:hypothetical protein
MHPVITSVGCPNEFSLREEKGGIPSKTNTIQVSEGFGGVVLAWGA